MRVLILSAVLACAFAAPSVPLTPVALSAVPIIAAPIDAGDVEAAVIDAKVKIDDLTIASEDRARALTDLANEQKELVAEQVKEKSEVIDDGAKEKTEEGFWSGEEKKWQAVDSVQTAEAQIQGNIASNADAIAKSLVFPAPVIAPIISPIGPLFYATAPELPTPAVKSELPVADKAAEPAKDGEKIEKESAKKPEIVGLNLMPLTQYPGVLAAPWALSPTVYSNLGSPILPAPITYLQPGLSLAPQQFLARY